MLSSELPGQHPTAGLAAFLQWLAGCKAGADVYHMSTAHGYVGN